jgi:hypothetical protein
VGVTEVARYCGAKKDVLEECAAGEGIITGCEVIIKRLARENCI